MKNVNLNVRITEELRDKFKEIAESNAQVPSLLIRQWIEEYVRKNENNK